MSFSSSEQSKRTQEIWKSSLISALRTALACIIVGIISLYGPPSLRHLVAFPSFSYFTIMLIIPHATLGDTIRGCWHALYATIQGVGPAIICLSIVGPAKLNPITTSLVVALSAFFIALPEWTHIVAKRIALGQIVLVYVKGYIDRGHTQTVMHPIHVVASTAVGALCCPVALLFPYPRLAYSEVKQNSKLFADNASERLKLFVKAFCAEDSASSEALISQAKFMATKGRKFLQCIKSRQKSMHWERFPIKFLWPYCENKGDRCEELERTLRGMEIALSNSSSLPHVSMLDEEFKDEMNIIEGEISQNLQQINTHLPCETPTVPQSDSGHVMDSHKTLETFPSNEGELPSYFFLFCMKLLHIQSRAITIVPNTPLLAKTSLLNQDQQPNETTKHQNWLSFTKIWANWPVTLSRERLVPALKCSLSLGFAVLFGLHYSMPNGFWSGLTVAISLAAAREPTFKVSSVKFQGTVIGTVYGVLVCYVFESSSQFRLLSLLPWFVFTSFLQQSKMFMQAGGVSAVIGAVLILGRRDFGTPRDFAIDRIVETFIGLFCSIVGEMVFQPTRAASLAKVQLSKALATLQNSLCSINLCATSKAKLMERQKVVRTVVSELVDFVSEAELEPNFWFLPFHSACYVKLVSSFSEMADLLLLAGHAIGFLEDHIQILEQMGCQEGLDKINCDLELVGKMTCSSIERLKDVCSIKSLIALEKDLVKKKVSCTDLELGTSSNHNHGELNLNLDHVQEMGSNIMSSLLDHFKEVVDKVQVDEKHVEIKSRLVMSFSALGFCLNSFMSETKEVETGIKELLQWENPSSHINLNEISHKIHALYK